MRSVPFDELRVGDAAESSKTIAESDIYLFAGITGDFAPNHVDEEYGRGTIYGGRIAHGMLVLSYASTTMGMMQARANQQCVGYGFERVRFTGGVKLGDTLTVRYEITELDQDANKSFGTIEIRNQRDELVVVATHILKFFD